MITGPFGIIFILMLILGNGFLAMAEISIVSARKALLQSRAEAGSRRDRVALDLANSPGNFLSTVQIGITLVGILAGVAGEASLAGQIEEWLLAQGLSPAYSQWIGVALVVVAITYMTLVFGELAPKQIGLLRAERIAVAVAPVIQVLSLITRPFVWLLSLSSSVVVRILGIRPSDEPSITEEEVKILIDQGTEIGVFMPAEDAIVDQVFRLGDQRAISITIPRHEIIWLDLEDPLEDSYKKMMQCDYSNYPVAQGDFDNLVGYVRANDLLTQCFTDEGVNLRSAIRPPLYFPESLPIFDALTCFRETGDEFAFVIDEYGGVQGLLTLHHLLEAFVEDLPSSESREHPAAIQRADGSWLLDGAMPVEDFRELFDLQMLPGEAKGHYLTLAGFVLTTLGAVPQEGDVLEWEYLRIEVMDMDGNRIDKVLVADNR